MTHFLAKINRGIALGIFMLIGLAVYFVIDARAFEGEAYEIRDAVVEFTDALNELHRGFTPEANSDFIRRFFTEYREAGRHPGIQSALQRAESTLEAFAELEPESLPASISFELSEITAIQKQSANAARVHFEVNFTATDVTEQTQIFTGFVRGRFGGQGFTVDALMLREGGEWRFARASVRMGGVRLWR
ncbi:MAG: hypothetical protein FWD90_01410 [Defluviitaleaceae bacterium]|nr:hypothetical protein [Defluviitaleaceae bacterium]